MLCCAVLFPRVLQKSGPDMYQTIIQRQLPCKFAINTKPKGQDIEKGQGPSSSSSKLIARSAENSMRGEVQMLRFYNSKDAMNVVIICSFLLFRSSPSIPK